MRTLVSARAADSHTTSDIAVTGTGRDATSVEEVPDMTTEQPPRSPVYHYQQLTSGLAIAALVLGIVGFSPLAVIFGHVAVHKINKGSGESGRGMAVAGLVLGWIGVAAFLLVLILVVVAIGSSEQSIGY